MKNLTLNIVICILAGLFYSCTETKNTETTADRIGVTATNSFQQDSIWLSKFVDESLLRERSYYPDLKILSQYVNPGYLLCGFSNEDLNGDGLIDYFLFLCPEKAETEIMKIFLRNSDNSLKLVSENSSKEYNSLEYAYLEPDSAGNGFTISYNISGAGRHALVTEAVLHFIFDQKQNNFFLNSHFISVHARGGRDLVDEDGEYILDEDGYIQPDTSDYEPDFHETLKTQKDFGQITFSEFDFNTVFGGL